MIAAHGRSDDGKDERGGLGFGRRGSRLRRVGERVARRVAARTAEDVPSVTSSNNAIIPKQAPSPHNFTGPPPAHALFLSLETILPTPQHLPASFSPDAS